MSNTRQTERDFNGESVVEVQERFDDTMKAFDRQLVELERIVSQFDDVYTRHTSKR